MTQEEVTFFNGQDWTSSSEQWFRADGQENWSYSINSSSFEDTHQYTVFIRSTDLTGNQETTPASSYFTFDSSLPTSEVLIEREFYNTTIGATQTVLVEFLRTLSLAWIPYGFPFSEPATTTGGTVAHSG